MSDGNESKYVRLLIVDTWAGRRLAQVDNLNDVAVGDLVDLDVNGVSEIGMVRHIHGTCSDGAYYSFIAELRPIYPVTQWWHQRPIRAGEGAQ